MLRIDLVCTKDKAANETDSSKSGPALAKSIISESLVNVRFGITHNEQFDNL